MGKLLAIVLVPFGFPVLQIFLGLPGDSAVAHVSCNLLMYNSRSYKHMFIAPLKIYQVRFGSFSRVKT